MAKTREVAEMMAAKPPIAMRLTKARLRQVTQAAFDEAFENGGVDQAEAFASGEPQSAMRVFFAERAARLRRATRHKARPEGPALMPHAADAPHLPATADGFVKPFMRLAAANPDRVYARVGGRNLTFGTLDARSAALASWLHASGVAPAIASRSCFATARPRSP